MLAHRTLRLTGRAGGEIDVGQLIRGDNDAEIAVGMILLRSAASMKASGPRAATSGPGRACWCCRVRSAPDRNRPGTSIAAIRSAGKCGSIGRYTPPALKTARTAASQSRLRSATTATTPSRRNPRANSARASRLARALSCPYVRLRSPRTAATRSGCASTRCSNNSCTRRSGSSRRGPASPSSWKWSSSADSRLCRRCSASGSAAISSNAVR